MNVHGPYPVMSRDPVTGDLTDQPALGLHYTADEETMAAHPELEPFRVAPAALQNVWAGDDPQAPAWTVPLRFPDDLTAAVFLGEMED